MLLTGCVGTGTNPEDTASREQSAANEQCVPTAILQDEQGDVTFYPDGSPPDNVRTAPIDLLEHRVSFTNETLFVNASIVEDPRNASDMAYRYWFGMEFDVDGGETVTADLRLHNPPYEQAPFIVSFSNGTEGIGTYEAHWAETNVSFSVPMDDIDELFQADLTVGMYSASADGRHYTGLAPGLGTGYMSDRVDPESPTSFDPITCAP